MSYLRGQIAHVWNLRRDSRRSVRVFWWISLVALIGFLIAPRQIGPFLAGVWILSSMLRGLLASAWSLLNLRDVFAARRTALRWTFWLALFASLIFYAGMQEQRATTHPLPPSVLLLLTCAVFPVFFVMLVLFSLYGAALGAYDFRNQPDLKAAVTLSVTAWWFCTLGALALALLILRSAPLNSLYSSAFVLGSTHYTIWLTRWMRRKGYEPQELAPRLANAILGRLNRRWTFRGKTPPLHLMPGKLSRAFIMPFAN